MNGLERAAGESSLEKPLREMVKLRASQINGCVYCVDMHSRDAVAGGDTWRRLNLVAVWREAPYFTARERAALALTEAVTRLADSPRSPTRSGTRPRRTFAGRSWPSWSGTSGSSTCGTGSVRPPGRGTCPAAPRTEHGDQQRDCESR